MDIVIPVINHNREKSLIDACMREERWAQKQLYESYYGKMMVVCMRYANTQEDASEIINEGFMKIFKNLHKYSIGTSLESWIRRIMVNCAIDFYRKAAKFPMMEETDCLVYQESEQETPLERCSAQDIMRMVQTLPHSYRAVFNLYAIEGFTHKEIADTLGVTESTSRANLVKARAKLQELLIKHQNI